jgi:hypothetical protein
MVGKIVIGEIMIGEGKGLISTIAAPGMSGLVFKKRIDFVQEMMADIETIRFLNVVYDGMSGIRLESFDKSGFVVGAVVGTVDGYASVTATFDYKVIRTEI